MEEQLNEIAYQIVPRKGWLWLIGLAILIGLFLIWSVFGIIEINIEGRGIVLNKSGLFTIQTPVQGVVRSLFFKPGEIVQQGSLVAEIYDAQKEILLKTTQIKVDHLTKEIERLRAEVKIETEASMHSLQTQLSSLKYEVKNLKEKLQFLKKEYKKRLDLYREGLIILSIVQDTERQISQIEVSLEEKIGKIADIQSKLKKTYRTEELKTKELELLKAEEEVSVINTSLQQNQIYSPSNGKIIEILVNTGEVVKEGEHLFNVEHLFAKQDFQFYGFFPSEYGKYIRKNQRMRMALSTVSENEFGMILSRIKEISDFAISEQAILNEIHNIHLARYLSNQQPVTQVIAEPINDPNDPSGLSWTSGKGPPIELSTGVVGKVEVTVERIHPIYYLFFLKGLKKTSLEDSF